MGGAMEYQKVNLEVDAQGRSQTRDQRIATITSMFQSGLVHPDIAKDAIQKLARGVYVIEIETTRLAVKPLQGVQELREVHLEEKRKFDEETARIEADRIVAQGLTPRENPTL